VPDPTPPATEPGDVPEPFRLPEESLDHLSAALAATVAEVRRHGSIIDRLDSEPPALFPATEASESSAKAEDSDAREEAGEGGEGPASLFILALADDEYAVELAALRNWVDQLLLPAYGREISTTQPWCDQWFSDDHLEAVARLHALWLAWQQLTDTEGGLAGPSTWHRDHLGPALAELRSPAGPFGACTTNAARTNHRRLPHPGESAKAVAA